MMTSSCKRYIQTIGACHKAKSICTTARPAVPPEHGILKILLKTTYSQVKKHDNTERKSREKIKLLSRLNKALN